METLKGSVLIVEDDSALLETLTQVLTDEGYFVVGAKDGAEAISMLDLVKYDLILLDLHLPKVDGAEVVKLFKDLAVTIPIVVMTGHATGPRFAQEMGLAGCLAKPFRFEELFAIVATYGKPILLPPDRRRGQPAENG
jgi:DNA-binding response OmpR family regulator